MRLVQKAKGLNQIPNYSFWRDFGALQAVCLLHILVFNTFDVYVYVLYVNIKVF